MDISSSLPPVAGKYTFKVLLKHSTWFNVGGAADVVFRPQDVEDLGCFLKDLPPDIPYTAIGKGSNLLVRDGGISGAVVRLVGEAFTFIKVDAPYLDVGAGALDRSVALHALNAGLGNLEFLIGIPGTIGGALRMNAGAYGQEIKDVLVWAEALDPQGNQHRLTPANMGFAYRHCSVPQDWIFTNARLQGVAEPPGQIKERIDKILAEREASQPIKGKTGGSTFRNPSETKAWVLIDKAGCRGQQIGQAQVSPKHCNFLLNLGGALAKDIEELGNLVRQQVFATSGIELQWEIVRIGAL